MAKQKKEERLKCRFLGPMAGPIKCSCSGAVVLHACFNSKVPSGYCSQTEPANTKDGPIKLADGTLTEERYIAFPFSQRDLNRGKEPWDNMALCCTCCPFREDPPAEIQELHGKLNEIRARLEKYEGAATLAEREAAVLTV